MSYSERYGDLIEESLNSRFDIITHGCNCFKNMGVGIAHTIKKTYPKAYETDLNSNPILGDISVCYDYKTIIINSYIQYYPGKSKYINDTINIRYNAIKSCLSKINKNFTGKTIGIPLIGCGYAGLDWEIVKPIIQEELKDMEVTVIFKK